MAGFIGDLVVRVTASTSALSRALSNAESMVQRSASRIGGFLKSAAKGVLAIGAVGAAGGLGLLKLAADAETMATQFKVLVGDADKAKRLLEDIGRFAAATPFEKMELGDAARQLLAFGGSTETVMDELRMLGDLSAGIGQPIGELAELYGKARIQGRLFAEDINQFQGRGINVTEQLAKKFGNVRKAVEQGRVTFDDLNVALHNMTGSGGKFNGMMDELSRTLAGKFSTLKDNLTTIGTKLGQLIQPYAEQALDFSNGILEGFNELEDKVGFLKELGAATFDYLVAMIKDKWDDVAAYMTAKILEVANIITQELEASLNPFKDVIVRAGKLQRDGGNETAVEHHGNRIAELMGRLEKARATIPKVEVKPFQAPVKPGAKLGQLGADLWGHLEGPLAGLKAKGLEKVGGLMNQGSWWAGTLDNWFQSGRQKPAQLGGAQLGGAMRRGSAEAYSALVQASVRQRDPNVLATEKQTAELKKPLTEIAQWVKDNALAVLEDLF